MMNTGHDVRAPAARDGSIDLAARAAVTAPSAGPGGTRAAGFPR